MSRERGSPETSRTPGERLVRRTGFGLAVFTLGLIAILLAVVGVVTAAAVTQTTDQSVDSNLHTAAENMLTALAPTPSPTPPKTALPETPALSQAPTDDAGATPDNGPGGDETGDGENDGSQLRPSASFAATSPPSPTSAPTATPSPTLTPPATASPSPTAAHGVEPGPADPPAGTSDTFFLILDTSGNVVVNPQMVFMSGFPNQDGAAVAAAGSEDWRTIDADGTRVRLLSEPMHALDGAISGVLQTGFVLTAHDEQQALIVRTIIIASLLGLLGAAIVTLFVTRRAMAPIRGAFEAERRFVASASHELKTPVAIVRSSAEILQREDLVEPEGRYLVEDVIAESDRLGRLVSDLLALASAEAGQISIHATVFDLRALVDEVVGRVSSVASDRGVRIEATSDEGSAHRGEELLVTADRERMTQLLMIFIDNAIDHSPPDGMVRVMARPVDEGSRSERAVVVVTDQGPGVPAAERQRIFEPFAKVAGRRRTTGTTGLGLAIARLLAVRLGATLAVSDAPGGGASFSVSLARQPSGAQRPRQEG